MLLLDPVPASVVCAPGQSVAPAWFLADQAFVVWVRIRAEEQVDTVVTGNDEIISSTSGRYKEPANLIDVAVPVFIVDAGLQRRHRHLECRRRLNRGIAFG